VPVRTLMLNKPREVITSSSDPRGRRTVIDLVPDRLRKGLFPVGRLDFHSEGLLLMTTDGELAQRVAHPSRGLRKTYQVKVKGQPREPDLERLRAGIVLDGRRTLPCIIQPLRKGVGEGGASWWTVVLREGRSRQIREMFLRVGCSVQRLRRITLGPLSLGRLPSGAWRMLTEEELARLRRATPQARR
jgi:23S rRNA pseudouridine2605 synthase